VLALAVIALLVDRVGISVARLSNFSSDLFALFAELEDITALPQVMHMTQAGDLVIGEKPDCEAFVSIRLTEVLSHVRDRLAPEQRLQLSLPL
jgi:hypothetical protein